MSANSAAESTPSLLPTYVPSAPSPNYTCQPTDGERTLQRTPSLSLPTPTSTYTKQSEQIAVTLFDQERDAKIPTYGRQGLISGTIYLENTEPILQVVVKIEGKFESNCSDGRYSSVKLINECHTLWMKTEDGNASPSLIPFSCVLPATYDYGNRRCPLPPSYASRLTDVPPMLVKSQYFINVCVERIRHRMIGFLTVTKHVVIPFNYYPRTRAHCPIPDVQGFFSAMKTSPDEWYQAVSEVKTRPNARLDPVYCNVFLPAALVYALKDTIPFHIQLNGSLQSIKKFLLFPERDDLTSGHSQSTKSSLPLHSQPTIRVYLLRQLSIAGRGCTAPQSIILAEGRLREVPPAPTSCESQDMIHLDWEGEVKCDDDISVGGFVAGNVTVKDFISLGVEPPKHKTEVSPFLAFRMTLPIRLVTDSYVEVMDYA